MIWMIKAQVGLGKRSKVFREGEQFTIPTDLIAQTKKSAFLNWRKVVEKF
jgi:hypothetical protein